MSVRSHFVHRRPSHPVVARVAGLAALLVVLGTMTGLPAGPGALSAAADTAPPSGTPATVSADALPTVQANGVVWAQVTVGNTVYATGEFTSARPAGAKAGTGETARGNLLAYDIRTGRLLPFAHRLDARGLSITASPDGTRVYVGGDFTRVDGQPRYRIAAFDTATGTLSSAFRPGTGQTVRALAATNSTVYAGGSFTNVNNVPRTKLAAIAASNGALLSWAPKADDGDVTAMTLVPGANRLVVGGRFTTLSGTAAYGLGALDPVTGAVRPFAANSVIRDAGPDASITSLRTDGTRVYGTGYVFGPGGNFEGTFAADAGTGSLAWMEDCHGDSYDVLPAGPVTYSVGHAHDCTTARAYPETVVRTDHRALAFTNAATTTLLGNRVNHYASFAGRPAPTMLTWFPTLAIGSYTKQYQSAWSLTGNADYVALGGEFPSVNGVAQSGLVRFAVRAAAPNRVAPAATGLKPTVLSQDSGRTRVNWSATSDMDNLALTYQLIRDGGATPVSTQSSSAPFWQLPTMGLVQTGLTPGSSHTYRVRATDPLGNTTTSPDVAVTVSGRTASPYVQRIRSDGARSLWRLDEPSGPRGYDSAGFDDLTVGTGVTRAVAGAIAKDTDTATHFDGTAAGTASTTSFGRPPPTFTVEAWVRTTSTAGGKVLGFGNQMTGNSTGFDRNLYVDATGRARFGVYDGAVRSLASLAPVNDGRWHHLAATLSSSGMVLYVDGVRVGQSSNTIAQNFDGVWRVGGDTLRGWPAQPASYNLAGDIDEVAVYSKALTAAQVAAHRSLGTTG